MATKKDIKAFLKEANLKEADIDRMWQEASAKNTLIANLIRQNIDWRNMNMNIIKSIPQEKENQIKRAKEARIKQEEEQRKKEMEAKIKQDKIDSLNIEDLLIERCLAKNLSSEELRAIVIGDSVAVYADEETGGARRWTESINTYVKILNRYFCITWERGLTENHDNEFYNQPVEVIKEEKVITTTVVNWKVR
jgi:hypothetical protein